MPRPRPPRGPSASMQTPRPPYPAPRPSAPRDPTVSSSRSWRRSTAGVGLTRALSRSFSSARSPAKHTSSPRFRKTVPAECAMPCNRPFLVDWCPFPYMVEQNVGFMTAYGRTYNLDIYSDGTTTDQPLVVTVHGGVRQLRHHLGLINPPHAVMCTQCPCWLNADWCLQPDVVANSGPTSGLQQRLKDQR